MDRTSESEYWKGPYGVLVPLNVERIIAGDGFNTRYQDGSETELFLVRDEPYGEKEYKEEHAIYNSEDGKWYYKV